VSNDNHEQERVVIEASILAVTLLFIVAGLKGITEDASTMSLLSCVAGLFIAAAIFATANMFLPASLVGVSTEFGLFIGVLGGLALTLFGIGLYEAGVFPLRGSMAVAITLAIVVGFAARRAYQRLYRFYHPH
jgi:hypothetical protein